MILCDDVRRRRRNPRKLDILGLLSTVIARESFPIRLTFSVYLVLTEGRGQGVVQIAIISADAEKEIYVGEPHPASFSNDSMQLVAVIVRIPSSSSTSRGCTGLSSGIMGRRWRGSHGW